MATVQSVVSDMLLTVKTREVQRGILAEAARDRDGAARHFLAAAHLELVLANDFAQAGHDVMAFRSQVSAASCLWRAGQIEKARTIFSDLAQNHPEHAQLIQDVTADLELSVES